ncbi:MAG TPA: hypothetical protein VK790_06310 [Solirubrobacteraceae bacterium]|jgi:hypothetical protein|nr:hypothetical protein [Solirubrobacteraceae bacterium]
MAQLSRPFQVVLVVFLLLAGVWLFALQGQSSSPSSSAPAASAPSSSSSSAAAAEAKGAAAPTHVYHGAAPGVEGLTRAVAKAHEAVAGSQRGAKQVEHESGEASTAPASSAHPSAPAVAKTSAPVAKTSVPAAKPTTHTTRSSAATKAPAKAPATSTVHKLAPPSHRASGGASLSGQRAVEADLAKGDVVVLLFWNPKGTDDVTVQRAVQQVRKLDGSSRQHVAVREASANAVASYGSVTRGVQVDATPTIFIINPHRQALVLTGVQDAFSIQQAIAEAQHPQPAA